MNTLSKSMCLVLLALLLTACGANAAQEEVNLAEIYTAAAASVEAQVSPTAAATSTPAATATLISFPTTAPMTVTIQNVASSSSQSTANGCNNATYVSDVTISDGTVLAPEEAFVKTWKFQNTGTCTWEADYLITFVSGNDMDGEDTEIGEEVASGSTGEISVSLVAPSSEGTYTGYWRLADADGNEFGQSVYVMIVVSDDASTLTPTATSEATDSTSTPTATTAAVTSTFTATTVPTEIPTEADTPVPEATASE